MPINLLRRHPGELLVAAGVLLGWVLIESALAQDDTAFAPWPYSLELQVPIVDAYVKVASVLLCFRAVIALMFILLLASSLRTLLRLNGSLFRFHLQTLVCLKLAAGGLLYLQLGTAQTGTFYEGWPWSIQEGWLRDSCFAGSIPNHFNTYAPLLNSLVCASILLLVATLSEMWLARRSGRAKAFRLGGGNGG